MPRYMLDTDISSYIMKGSNATVIKRLQKVAFEDVCISAIVKSELAFGAEVSPRHMQDLARLETFLKYMEVLDYPSDAATHYGDIRLDLQRQGTMIGSNDLLIAAHARSLGLTLVTNNTREFQRVRGLKLENWA